MKKLKEMFSANKLLNASVVFWLAGHLLDFISTLAVICFVPGGHESNPLMIHADGSFDIVHAIFLKTLSGLLLLLAAKIIKDVGKDPDLASLPFWYTGWHVWMVALSNFSLFVVLIK